MIRRVLISYIKSYNFCLLILFLLPITLHASLIESTIGAAVVNDATATYYNPAALTLLKNSQFITIGSAAFFRTHFTGQATQITSNFNQFGHSDARTNYYLPSFYVGTPITKDITIGVGVIYNYFFRKTSTESILRYVQSNNHIQDINLVPAIGIKLNDFFALGIGLNFNHVNFLMEPISGFPLLNIIDRRSKNESGGKGWGVHGGFLLKPNQSTIIGFNYRSAITYQLSGKSIFEGDPEITSDQYHLKFWTPPRAVLSLNHFLTPRLGFIGTIQYIQWNLFKDITLHGIVTQLGQQAIIVPSVKVPYHLHNSWALTLGSHYRITSAWIFRFVGSYNESPANGNFQISNGDSYILVVSSGYDINKYFTLDAGYAFAYLQNQRIKIASTRNRINGINKGNRNIFSLKLTFNIV